MKEDIELFLNLAVKKSLGVKDDYNKYSIKECADNEMLKEGYDPMDTWRAEIFAKKMRERLGVSND